MSNKSRIVAVTEQIKANNVAIGQMKTKVENLAQVTATAADVATDKVFVLPTGAVANGAATLSKPEQTKTMALAMASGDQMIAPDSGKVLTAVTVTKPATLLPENIKQGVNIGGVLGTLTGGAVAGAALSSIAITTPPTKLTYTAGDAFDPAGMVVTATYSNGATRVVTGCTYAPAALVAGGNVTVSFTEFGATKTAVVAVTVKAAESIPASIDFNATVGDNTLHLQNQAAGYDCTIHWGDGTETVAPVNGGNVIHNYATAGVRNITITGNSFAGFFVNRQAGKEKYVAVHKMGKWKNDTMTILDYCLAGCTSLTTLPADLFKYNTAVMSFSCCFIGCTSLTTLPADLFKYNTSADSFVGCFRDCTALTAREDIFGLDYNGRFAGKQVQMTQFMGRDTFTGIQGMAPRVWKFNFNHIEKQGCFSGLGNSAASLANYAEIPAEWK